MKKIHDNANDPVLSTPETHIPFRVSMLLSPLEKYKIYGRFPWKMTVHILLVIVTTAQVLLIIAAATQYTRAQERLFYNNFISTSDKLSLDYPHTTYLYSISQVRDHVKSSVSNFYSFKKNSLENVKYMEENPEKLFISMEFRYFENEIIIQQLSSIPKEFSYRINSTSWGPFEYPDEELKIFFASVKEFSLNYTLETYVPFNFGDYIHCYHWNIEQTYSFFQRGHFVVTLKIHRHTCHDINKLGYFDTFISRLLWIHIIVVILSSVSIILTWRYVYKFAKFFWKIKRKVKHVQNKSEENNKTHSHSDSHSDSESNPEDTNKKDNKWYHIHSQKQKFFNMWSVISIIGNIVQLFASVISLFDADNVMTSTEILVGFGCMLAYINSGRYLTYNKDYSIIFATIQRALPNVLRYLLGVMPIFFGFIFFGLCIFWRSERFFSTSSTMITLFAVINGDRVYDMISDITGVSFFLGQVYSYLFCILFIIVVMNVFISIIEEAYVSTKMKNQDHWIYSYLKIDPNYVQIGGLDHKPGKIEKEKEKENQAKGVFSKTKGHLKKLAKTCEMSKEEIKGVLEGYLNEIIESIKELESIAREITQIKDLQLRKDLRNYLLSHIANLEKGITQIRKLWQQ